MEIDTHRVIKAETILVLTSGEYSDYLIGCVLRVLRDFTVAEIQPMLVRDGLLAHDRYMRWFFKSSPGDWIVPSVSPLAAWLIAQGYADEIENYELNVENLGDDYAGRSKGV